MGKYALRSCILHSREFVSMSEPHTFVRVISPTTTMAEICTGGVGSSVGR